MRIAIALVFVWLLPRSACAAFADFNEYTQSQTFAAGDIFQSGDLSFKALNWLAITNPVKVNVVSILSPSLNAGPGVEFLLPSGVREVTMSFSDGAGVLIAINGTEPAYPPRGANYPAGFGYLDGASIGGVDIDTMLTTEFLTFEIGTLTLRGAINSLAFAGLELTIDDISVRVPEPAAGGLFALGVLGATKLRRRGRC
jgi:hypothetical protein